jgi:hypothetical protein
VQGNAFYRGRQVLLQGEQSGFGFYGMSIQREFANKKGSFGFGARNFLTNVIRIENEIRTPLLAQNSINESRNLSLQVNFSYRIGQLSADQRPRRRRGINNDDLKSDGDGGNDIGGDAPAGGGGRNSGGGGGARPAGGGNGRPAGAPGSRPGGTGQPGALAPNAAPGAPSAPGAPNLTAPADSTTRDSTTTLPAGQPAPATPAAPAGTVRPGQPTRQPAAPPTSPVSPPANAPSPGTTTPGGITPAGSPGGRP